MKGFLKAAWLPIALVIVGAVGLFAEAIIPAFEYVYRAVAAALD